MSAPSTPPSRPLKSVLKRGFLLAAANWQLILIQFLAESTFKLLLSVPVVAGAVLVVLLFGGTVSDLMAGSLRETLQVIAAILLAQPATLAAFVVAFGIVLAGGSAFTFLVKGGTIMVLVAGDARAGSIERPALRPAALGEVAVFSIDRFVDGCRRLFPRYCVLGFLLLAVYGLSGAAYLGLVVGSYGSPDPSGLRLGWTILAVLSASALVAWITLVNLFYLLTQIVIAIDDRPVPGAMGQAMGFVRGAWRDIIGVFLVMLGLVALGTMVSIMVTTGLGLVAFVPLAGLAAFPLQVAAWLTRGFVFQTLSLGAIGAYLSLYRARTRSGPAEWA